MEKFTIIGASVMIFASIVVSLLIRVLLKKSLVANISYLYILAMGIIAASTFIVGHLGLKHLSWVLPLGTITVVTVVFQVRNRVLSPMKELLKVINSMQNGDLTIPFNEKILRRQDEIGQISLSVDDLVSKLNQVVKDIKESTEVIMNSSLDLTSSSQILANASSGQAATVEEISAAVEEMLASITQNSGNASTTADIARAVNSEIQSGSEATSGATEQMQLIAAEIDVISDIAAQTNILALNASVEAARAGEHGRGFSVVAAEVRKLAENSKKAADKITSLTGKGVEISNMAGELLLSLIPNVNKTAQLVEEINLASQEQSVGSTQIGQSIINLNQVAQENAATSEELATHAEQLKMRAKLMTDSVNFFHVN